MIERQEFKLRPGDEGLLAAASKPIEAARVAGVAPSPCAWQVFIYTWASIGERHGFEWTSARPVEGKGPRHLSALPLEAPCPTGQASSSARPSGPSSVS